MTTKAYRGWGIASGLWAPPVFFDPITAGVPEFDKLVVTKGYQDPPIEEPPAMLRGPVPQASDPEGHGDSYNHGNQGHKELITQI